MRSYAFRDPLLQEVNTCPLAKRSPLDDRTVFRHERRINGRDWGLGARGSVGGAASDLGATVLPAESYPCPGLHKMASRKLTFRDVFSWIRPSISLTMFMVTTDGRPGCIDRAARVSPHGRSCLSDNRLSIGNYSTGWGFSSLRAFSSRDGSYPAPFEFAFSLA